MFFRRRLTSRSYTILRSIHCLKLSEICRETKHTSTASSAENFTYCLLSKIETNIYYILLTRSFRVKFLVSFKPNQTA
jgi:hypothetical protein